MSIKKGKGAQGARRTYNERAKLKDLGFFSKTVDLRKKPTKYQLKIIDKFRAVLDGNAAVVDVGRKGVKDYKKGFLSKGSLVVVPKQKGERVTFDKGTGFITAKSKGRNRIIVPQKGKPLKKYKAKKGRKIYYTVPFANGGKIRFDDFHELQQFMNAYKSYMNWRDYMEIEDVADYDYSGDDE